MSFPLHLIWLQGWEFAPDQVKKRVEENRGKWIQAGASSIELWDESRIKQLLSGDKGMLHWFVGLQTTIAKCDIGRAFILHVHGGVYADTDFDPEPNGIQKLWKEAVDTKKVLFPSDKSMGLVNNYLIAAIKGNAFWTREYLPSVAEAVDDPSLVDAAYALLRPTWPVLSTHGPVMISRLAKQEQSSAAASSIATSELGFHGYRGGGDSFWYKTRPERFQTRLALATLGLAVWGILLTLYLVLAR